MSVRYCVNFALTCFRPADEESELAKNVVPRFIFYTFETPDGNIYMKDVYNLARTKFPSLKFLSETRLTLSWKNSENKEFQIVNEDQFQAAVTYMTQQYDEHWEDYHDDQIRLFFYMGSDQLINHTVTHEFYAYILGVNLNPFIMDTTTRNPLLEAVLA